jgi:hypothetical protein
MQIPMRLGSGNILLKYTIEIAADNPACQSA